MTPGPSNLSHPDIFMILQNWKARIVDRRNDLKECKNGWKGEYYPPDQVASVKRFKYALDMKQVFSDWKIETVSSCFRECIYRSLYSHFMEKKPNC